MYSLLFFNDVIDIGEFDKLSDCELLVDAVFSLLIAWLVEMEVIVESGPSDCDGVVNVGVFGGDSSFTCRADFNLSITALSEPLRFLFA